jgi:hypothetical protein
MTARSNKTFPMTVNTAMDHVWFELSEASKQSDVDFYSTLYLALGDLNRGSNPIWIVRNGRCIRRGDVER